jgi:hypothetical protein
MALGFGTLLYVALLLVNAMAVLSEDRFLARSAWAISFMTVCHELTLELSWLGVDTLSSHEQCVQPAV